jgi:hypothetical protein
MAFNIEMGQHENWVDKLEVSMRAGYQTFLDGWQSASAMLQEQTDLITNPACTCKRHCENSQLILPMVVEDEVSAYTHSGGEMSSTSSPFSPRGNGQAVKRPIVVKPECNVAHDSDVHADIQQLPSSKSQEHPADIPPYVPPMPVEMGGFYDYYAEEMPVLPRPASLCSSATGINAGSAMVASVFKVINAGSARPAESSICSSNINAAAWEKPPWADFVDIKTSTCQTGSSLASKGGVSTSQAAEALQSVQPYSRAGMPLLPSPHHVTTHHEAVTTQIDTKQADTKQADTQQVGTQQIDRQVDPQQIDTQAAGPQLVERGSTVLEEQPEVRAESPKAATVRSKPVSQAKSVLSQSMVFQSSAAMALGQISLSQLMGINEATAEEEEEDKVQTQSPKPQANRRKPTSQAQSVLSQSMSLKSSAAMALSQASERPARTPNPSCAEAPPDTKTLPLSVPVAKAVSKVNASESKNTLTKSASKHSLGSSRPRGVDAKSVISGLNSSSSASALLGPMLQGQPKRRQARPQGADVASVI